MSAETALELARAASLLSTRRAEADSAKRTCLESIAADLPAAVDRIAKRTAQAEPEVTKSLGKTGIATLRGELKTKADELALEIASAIDEFGWPYVETSKSSYVSSVTPGQVNQAFFKFAYGRRTNALAAVFKKHGYSIHDDNSQRSQGLVLPQYLCEDQHFEQVATALSSLAKAHMAFNVAKAADDKDIVNEILG